MYVHKFYVENWKIKVLIANTLGITIHVVYMYMYTNGFQN